MTSNETIKNVSVNETTVTKVKKASGKLTVYQMATTALMAAVMCILGPLSIPIGTVPISFTMLAVFFAVFLLGMKLGTLSYAIYFLLGLAGLPVFSGFSGGVGKVAGPTGGYLIGFFFMALIMGFFVEKFPNKPIMAFLGMFLGMAVSYLFGTLWFVMVADCTFAYAIGMCVAPFVVFDLVKIVIALIAGPMIRKRLVVSGLIRI